MSFIVENWLLILVALVSGGLLAKPLIVRGGGNDSVQPTGAVLLINREKAVVIDVSEPAEFEAGHIVNARHIPLASLTDGAAGLPSNKSFPLIVSTSAGGQAARAVRALKALGYQRVYSLAGGLKAWTDAGMPVDKGAPSAPKALKSRRV